ncbi:hypothetical protein MMUR_08880 [Mycolicibacterium murale]|uniref:Uncharacterized protein n=1 Tax=Mycolicibacterium murale TaxID=182220 RepID=A0A7I9WG99_9MYCO|nr:hypothetical protein [Mycolicibacterium murale]MCV7182529.1 hypothetical protein [Mycolicibacterium murale]GFG56752.1 hypothetical protein MMUR_08880 [Mycolicibacterium murale]
MIMLFVSDPVALVITIGVLGASFLPFLAITLLFLLNSKTISKQWRSGKVSNAILAVGAVLFLYLLVQ